MTPHRYECPSCHLGVDTIAPARLEHHCPHNRNRRTPFVEVIKEKA